MLLGRLSVDSQKNHADSGVGSVRRHTLHHLITTDIAPAVPPSHFDALTFKDSPKHQTGAPNKNDT